jgi:hypothetical protein
MAFAGRISLIDTSESSLLVNYVLICDVYYQSCRTEFINMEHPCFLQNA